MPTETAAVETSLNAFGIKTQDNSNADPNSIVAIAFLLPESKDISFSCSYESSIASVSPACVEIGSFGISSKQNKGEDSD